MDDDSSEVRDIKALIDLRLIRDLEMVLSGLPFKGFAAEIQAGLMEEILKIVDLRQRPLVVITAVTHIADVVKFRAGHHLFDIRQKNVLMTLRIARISEKITINNVFQLVCHLEFLSICPSIKYVTAFLGFQQ